MSATTVAQRRRWAPPNARIDQSHPLARGLADAWLPGRSNASVANRLRAYTSGTISQGSTSLGPALTMSSAIIGVTLGTLPAQTDTSKFSFVAVANRPSAAANGPLVGYRNGGGPGTTFAKLSGNIAGTQNYAFFYFVNGVNRSVVSTVTKTFGDQPQVLVAVKDGLTLNFWVDGVLTTSTFTTGQLDQNAATYYLGPGDEAATDNLVMAAAWPSRALSAAEAAMVTADPFCFLRPPTPGSAALLGLDVASVVTSWRGWGMRL